MNSLRTKIFILFFALLFAIDAVTLFTIYVTMRDQADRGIRQQLEVGREVFNTQFESRRRHLSVYSHVIARDYGLLSTLHDDPRSLHVALDNHRNRVGADLAIITDMDGSVLADTEQPDAVGQTFEPGLELTEAAQHNRFLTHGLATYQLVVAPLLAPNPVGQLYLGYVVDDRLARQFESITALEVSFVAHRDAPGTATVVGSTVPREHHAALASRLREESVDEPAGMDLDGERFISLMVPLERPGSSRVYALLQQSQDAALAVYRPWWLRIAEVSALVLLLALGGAWLVARGLVRPIRLLADQAHAIARGNYETPLSLQEQPGRAGEIGELVHAFRRMQDAIAEREASIRHNAYHDQQTGLINRYRLEQLVDEYIAVNKGNDRYCAVLSMGVARFKDINETLGYHVGDRLLRDIGTRLQAAAGSGDIVSRLGGDAFGVMLDAVTPSTLPTRLQPLLEALNEPFSKEGLSLHIAAVTGVAVFPEHGHDAGTLLRHADAARYLAKERRTRYEIYSGSQDRYSLLRVSLLGEMQSAMDSGDIRLHYQPKVDLVDDQVREVEALLRWQHPDYGMIPPQEFISMVENTGNIHVLTTWVIAQALKQVAAWHESGLQVRVAVNISAHDLFNVELVHNTRAALERAGVSAGFLRLEITESAVVENEDTVLESLRQLHELGVVLSIDDYGTGYSSLAQLKRLPVNELKIDKSFVIALTRGSDDEIIVRSTIELGHLMGLDVCAEGVETADTLALMRELGCETVQGYHFSKPLPADDLANWVRARAGGELVS